MSSKRVAWSTLTNSVSKALVSSSEVSDFLAPTWYLQYSITLARIFELTFGSGMAASVPVSVARGGRARAKRGKQEKRREGGEVSSGVGAFVRMRRSARQLQPMRDTRIEREGGRGVTGGEGSRTLDHVLDGLRFAAMR